MSAVYNRKALASLCAMVLDEKKYLTTKWVDPHLDKVRLQQRRKGETAEQVRKRIKYMPDMIIAQENAEMLTDTFSLDESSPTFQGIYNPGDTLDISQIRHKFKAVV